MKSNSIIKQIHVKFRKIPFHPNKMPSVSFGCWVHRIAMQIHQQYQFHVVSFTCIIQKDLRLPVPCIVAFSTPNKKHQWKPCLYQRNHFQESNFEKKKNAIACRVHWSTFPETFCKPNLLTVQLHQHSRLNLPKPIISDQVWPVLIWLINYFSKSSTSFTCLQHRAGSGLSPVLEQGYEVCLPDIHRQSDACSSNINPDVTWSIKLKKFLLRSVVPTFLWGCILPFHLHWPRCCLEQQVIHKDSPLQLLLAGKGRQDTFPWVPKTTGNAGEWTPVCHVPQQMTGHLLLVSFASIQQAVVLMCMSSRANLI